jgi:preprotein translocase subunit SecE
MAAEQEEQFEEAKTLGLERWVQFAFVGVAALVFFVGDKLISFVWSFFGEPPETFIPGIAAVIGILTGYLLYRNSTVKPYVDEVAGELSKVTWPTRPETWRNTVVVIVTSVIAAIFLGVFDTVWSAFTDLIYATT